ncbi:cytochrome P450 [Streptomyces paludis]|uniref:cytochrome P450 n=1 Tax=Streptomyces paludis TaxID=2282738 RepID=UPI0038B68A65
MGSDTEAKSEATTTEARAEATTGTPPGAATISGAVPLNDPRFQTDPVELYRELRRDHGAVAPILLDGDIPAWLVIGYRELHQVTGDPALYSRDSVLWNQWDNVPDDWPLLPMIGRGETSIIHTTNGQHRERAAMISDALEAVDPFTLRQHAERLADELIDSFCADGRTDIIGRYTMLLPVRVLARLLGFTDEQGPGLVTALNEMLDGGEDALTGHGHLVEAATALLTEKADGPGADVVSRMLANRGDFTVEEITKDLLMIMVAGHQPTADWIGNTLRLMLTDDRFAASLSGGRHSVGEAMTEVLWEDTPTQNVPGRWATRDTNLGNRRIRAGDLLILGVAAANFDPQIRTDSSVLTGGNTAFFSFGHGEHRCPFPAQEIAEVIARTGIEVLLDRLPDIDLAVPGEALAQRPSPWLRGLTSLPVIFSPAPALSPARRP